MKVTINELRVLIAEIINEVSDVNAATLRLRDLVISSARDPRTHGPTLLAFVRGLGGDESTVSTIKNALMKRDLQGVNAAVEGFISSRIKKKPMRPGTDVRAIRTT